MLNISSVDERLKGYQPMWENWYIDSQIYNGVNSRVYRIKRNRDGINEYAAMKVVTVTLDDDKMFISQSDGMKYLDDRCRQAKVEINNMIKLQRSPYIVSYYDDAVKEILDENGAKCGYDMMIRMEYLTCFGTKIRNSDKGITEQDVINLAFDVGNALKAVHKCNMIHRDIKPDNIFVDEEGYYKLGDLGVTKNLNATGYASTKTGTEPYAAPEVWRTDKYTENAYTYKADIYSFGIVLYQLLNNNYLPFMNEFTHNEIEKSIALRMKGEAVPMPANGDEGLKKIICKMCEFDPDNRYKDMSAFLSDLSAVGMRVDNDSSDSVMNLDNGVISEDMIATLNANDDTSDNIEFIPSAGSEIPVTATESRDDQNSRNFNDLMPSVSPEVSQPESTSEADTQAQLPEGTQTDTENHEPVAELNTEAQLPEGTQTDTENHEPVAELNTEAQLPEETQTDTENHEPVAELNTQAQLPEETQSDTENHEPVAELNTQAQLPEETQSDTENHESVAQSLTNAEIPEESQLQTGISESVESAELSQKTQSENEEISVKRHNFIIPEDGVFRNTDYRTCRVKNGVLDIPDGYSEIESFTLYGIERNLITKIIMPESVKRIDEATFKDFINLKEINISDNIMIIRRSIFEECQSLESLVIPLNVRKIEDYAFNGCKSLKTIDICGYVTGIGQNAFVGCDNVTVRCKENSFVYQYCVKHNIKTELI